MNTKKNIIIPEDFRYREVLLRGKPVHDRFDSFSIRHPPMPLEKRAKIFSPFDALKGLMKRSPKRTSYMNIEKTFQMRICRSLIKSCACYGSLP